MPVGSIEINESGVFFRVIYIGFSHYRFTFKETRYTLKKAGQLLGTKTGTERNSTETDDISACLPNHMLAS